MTRTVLRGARWPGDVAWSDGRITAVGSVPAEDGDEVIRVDGDIVTAGLINTHHHFYQWMTRGWAFDCTLFGWLTTLYPVWARLTPEDVEVASAVAMGELALTGCTTAADHHYVVPGGDDSVFDAIASAARTIGIRAHIARGSMDLGQSRGGLPPDSVVEDLDAILASTESVHQRLHDGDRIVVTVAPCSPFSVTTELMTASAELARRLGLRLHTHLAETLDEERGCLERFGKRPLAVLDEMGWIAADVWVAHGIHFDDAEVARLGETRTGIAHCPSSNCRLGSGIARVVDLNGGGSPRGAWRRRSSQQRDRWAVPGDANGAVPGPPTRPQLDHVRAGRRAAAGHRGRCPLPWPQRRRPPRARIQGRRGRLAGRRPG